MRIWAVTLVAVAGFGAFSMLGACSDSLSIGPLGSDAGTGGDAGSPDSGKAGAGQAGASHAGSSGATMSEGGASGATMSEGGASGATMSEGGAAGATPGECGFYTVECSACLTDNCSTEVQACGADSGCLSALTSSLPNCACDPKNKFSDCAATFVKDFGDLAQPLVTCFSAKCMAVCK